MAFSFHCHMCHLQFKMLLPPAKKQKIPACIREIQVHKLWSKVYSQKGLTAMQRWGESNTYMHTLSGVQSGHVFSGHSGTEWRGRGNRRREAKPSDAVFGHLHQIPPNLKWLQVCHLHSGTEKCKETKKKIYFTEASL